MKETRYFSLPKSRAKPQKLNESNDKLLKTGSIHKGFPYRLKTIRNSSKNAYLKPKNAYKCNYESATIGNKSQSTLDTQPSIKKFIPYVDIYFHDDFSKVEKERNKFVDKMNKRLDNVTLKVKQYRRR